ncbi:MAG: hypothetical protein QE487_19150 [Fluviicola sp.]|nr:hypothetical protein [Fluviicola sp.]
MKANQFILSFNFNKTMKLKIVPLLLTCLVLIVVARSHAQMKDKYVKREFAMCSFNQLIADTEKSLINKKLETIEIHDFNGGRTFYWITDSTVRVCFIFDFELNALVECSWLYQYPSDSLMIDAFLKGGKTIESVLVYDKSCLDCPAVSHVVYKIRRRRCPKIISSTIIVGNYGG